ncbi:MAG TPA: acyltransferase domain-containing protein, partial [Acidimicrobiia bacterium]|nr:acyltransferase domain-containing protein [Acidimicrobiia bacterium]
FDAEAMAAARREDGGRLWVANVNAPGQVVVAGGTDDLAWASAHASAFDIKRVIPLKVAGAFHSPFMATAAAQLGEALAGASVARADFPVWANATALPYTGDVAGTLVAQLTSPVRFADTLAGMAAAGVRRFVHVGPGDVTAGLAKRSVQGAEAITVSSVADVPAAVATLADMSTSID